MEPKDWITTGSVAIAIVGWIYNGHMVRRHEIFKRKLDFRFGMYESCVEVAQVLEKIFQSKDSSKALMEQLATDFVQKLGQCQIQVLMYGTEFEIRQIETVAKLAQLNRHIEMKSEFSALMRSVRSSLRKDLGLPKLLIDQ